MKKPKIIALTGNIFKKQEAKTTHGLIRFTSRFQVVSVIDYDNCGQDAGKVLDGKKREIPILKSVEEAMSKDKVELAIIGVATHGGIIPESLHKQIEESIKNGLSIINPLHNHISKIPFFSDLSKKHNIEITDLRKPKPQSELKFWSGKINEVDVPIVAILGTDCAMGKRTTTQFLIEECENNGINAQMIYTGQTGWLQGNEYGFIFDCTLNDFIPGELEDAIYQCWKKENPEIIFIEGQSSLRNPSGPCGSEFLISGNARHTILIHQPSRKYFDYCPERGEIPSIQSEIELIRMYNSEVIGVALNTIGIEENDKTNVKNKYEANLNLPVFLPVEEGVSKIIPTIKKLVNKDENKRDN